MLSINTIARVLVNVRRSAAQPTSFDTGLLLVKDSAFADSKRLGIVSVKRPRAPLQGTRATIERTESLESVVITVNVRV